jgi:hypothetical protein
VKGCCKLATATTNISNRTWLGVENYVGNQRSVVARGSKGKEKVWESKERYMFQASFGKLSLVTCKNFMRSYEMDRQ